MLLPIAAYAVRHRHVRGAGWYAALLSAVAFWSLMYAWELTAGEVQFKILALKVKYLAVAALPSVWLGFVLDFVGTDSDRTRASSARPARSRASCCSWPGPTSGTAGSGARFASRRRARSIS